MQTSATSSERSILTVTCYGHFISHFNMLVFPAVLLPLAGRLGMPMEQVLGLSFFMYLLFGVTALPWGILADRIGPRILLGIFYVGVACCALLASFTVDVPEVFSLALAGIGLFSGIYHPAGLGWIAREIPNTSRAMAFNGMFGNLGLAVAPLLAGFVNYFWGISSLYQIVALFNLTGTILLVNAIRQKQPHSHQTSEKKKTKAGAGWTPFLILLGAMTLGGIAYRGTSVTLPAYFEVKNEQLYMGLNALLGDFGSANLTATLLTSFIYLVGMLGQYFGGKVAERYDLRIGYLCFHLITIPMALAMGLSSNWPLFAFALLHSFFLLGMQPIENTLVTRLTPPKLLSSAFGTKFIFTFGFGAVSVKLIEQLKARLGMESVYFGLAGVSTLLCAIVILLIVFTNRQKKNIAL